ncbi:MAG: DUF882 domain-containing protein [Bryobacteraceae bacterium]
MHHRSLFPVVVLLFTLSVSGSESIPPVSSLPEANVAPSEEGHLRLYHTHTGQRLDLTYREGSRYIPEALSQLDYFLRDHRTGAIHHFDPRLFDLLSTLMTTSGNNGAELHVVCGYRSPWSNEYLRTHTQGVAKKSLHMEAEAIDIRLPGFQTAKLRDVALSLGKGGVGYYSGSNFIHVDVGRVRRW